MIDMVSVFVGVTVLFGVLIALRSISSLKICALCGAVSMTWITLLGLMYAGKQVDPVLIGLLMGGSVVGIMYLLENKLSQSYHLFKLPFYLTLVALAYTLIEKDFTGRVLVVIAFVWVVAVVLYMGRGLEGLKKVGQKVIECCRDW